MKTETLSILTFLIAFLCYGFVGFLWLLYDSAFVSATTVSSTSIQSSSLVLAAKIQTVDFISLMGAVDTGLYVSYLERRPTVQRSSIGMP
ncbi:hypothetical protein E6H23_00710 [Candidatus Bathyarchaeota archaeon]|nr:MAG: hypothetical protein E6H23_00710 [Candidatus Bathyarchaeota archaeon]